MLEELQLAVLRSKIFFDLKNQFVHPPGKHQFVNKTQSGLV
jgi:hypothetical protein